MAKPNPLVMKIVFIGVPVLIGVALLPTNPPSDFRVQPGKVDIPKKGDSYSQDKHVQKFPSTGDTTRTSFKPGVIPSTFTNSQDPWIYTGSIEVNGQKKALFENKNSGEAVYLGPGENWRGLKLLSIDGDSIIVSGTEPGTGGQAKLLSFGTSNYRTDGAAAPVGYAKE